MARINVFAKIITAAFALTTLIIGCGTETSPVASNEPTFTPSEDGRTFLTFSPQAAQRAAKIAGDGNYKSKTKTFLTSGTSFNIKHNNITGNTEDNLKLIFSVPAGALTQDTAITMGTYGGALSQLLVIFEPDGLVFLNDAQFEIQLGPELVDLPTEGLIIYHIHSDGTVEEIVPTIEYQGSVLHLYISVPGFSRYSSGGGQ